MSAQIMSSQASHSPRSRNRRALWFFALLGAVLIAVLVVAGVLLFLARNDMQAGAQDLKAVQAATRISQRSQLLTVLPRVQRQVRTANTEFSQARLLLTPLSPFLPHLAGVPRIGDELAAAPDLAAAGVDTTGGVVTLLAALKPAVHLLAHAHLHLSRVLPLLAHNRGRFSQACHQFQRAELERRGIGAVHTPSLRSAVATFDHRVPELRVVCAGLVALPGILGYPQPRTYLLANEDPQELRATGGFIGSADLLTLKDGTARQKFQWNSAFRYEDYVVPSPQPMRYYNREPYWLFRDSNWSPDFPVTAALERFFLRLDLHRKVQGVIDLTPQCAADLLAATGPVYLPAYHRWVTSANVAQLTDYYAHWSPYPGPIPDESGKQFIGIVAHHILSRQRSLSTKQLLHVIQEAGTAVKHGDLLAYFDNRSAESFTRIAGASGTLLSTPGDYLYVVDSNLSYNKINPYIHESIRYHVSIRPDRWLQSRLTIRFTNRAPAALAVHGLGPGAGRLGGPIDYADFVRIYVPAGAQIIDQSGWMNRWTPGPAYGKMMFCGYLIVRNGETRTVHINYVVPPNVFSWSHGTRYRLTIQHQPGNHLQAVHVSVQAGTARRNWSAADPTVDGTVSMPVPPRPFQPIPLPKQPRVVVAPGARIEPHTFVNIVTNPNEVYSSP